MTNPSPHDPQPMDGECDARFAAVREAFATNLACDDEIGAAVCVHVAGRKVVDLWGGYAHLERREPWRADTIVNAYSIGKGVLSVLVLALAERGELDLDVRIADVWPEFAAHDKGEIRFPTLISHSAGLPAIRKPLPDGAMFDWHLMCSSLADQAPYWKPGTSHGYHSATFGYLVGEVIRRATGLPVDEALRRFVTGPLDADFAWGIDREDHKRVAALHGPSADLVLSTREQWAAIFPPTGDPEHDEMKWHSYFNPNGLSGGGWINRAKWRQAVVPSANGHCTARAVAEIYDALLAHGGRPPLLASSALVERGRTVLADGDDLILGRPSRFGLGFQLTQPHRPLGGGPRSFGHYGYGGSLGFADPENAVAFGYVRNKPGDRWKSPQARALVDALYEAIGK
ncbi:MAG: beta-lactamase family protein [bacterium]|nr:beta-lactamase family protein [bacterium]